MDTEGVVESVHINRVSPFREIVIRVIFAQGQSELSLIMGCLY